MQTRLDSDAPPEGGPDGPDATQERVIDEAPSDGSQAHQMLGRVLVGRYRIVDFIASGGMGRVYVAEQLGLGRQVAIKVLDTRIQDDWNDDGDFRRRFEQEAALASQLAHPNIVVVHDYGVDESLCFIVMEYLEGLTVEKEVRQTGPLQGRRLLHVTRQACSALGEAHRAGLIHRDLKPSNLILLDRGREKDFLKLVDFGLVKQLDTRGPDLGTKPGTMMGSPAYLSPEQVLSETVTQATDIYSLGAVMFFMATGQPPFRERTEYEMIKAHVEKSPPYLRDVFPESDVSPQFEYIIRRCLSKNPADRFSTIDELEESLGSVEAMFSEPPAALPATDASLGLNSGLQLRQPDPAVRLPSAPPVPVLPMDPQTAAVAGFDPHSVPLTPPTAHPRPSAAPRGFKTSSQGSHSEVKRAAVRAKASKPKRSSLLTPLRITVLVLLIAAGAVVAAIWATPTNESAQEKPVQEVTEARPEATVTVTARTATQDPGVVEVYTEPPGAKLLIDGQEVGTTPLRLALSVDDAPWDFTIIKEGFVSRSIHVDAGAGKLDVGLERSVLRQEETLEPTSTPSSGARPRTPSVQTDAPSTGAVVLPSAPPPVEEPTEATRSQPTRRTPGITDALARPTNKRRNPSPEGQTDNLNPWR